MTNKNSCIFCGDKLPPPADTGRPRRYCDESCKRGAGYEIVRVNRRLEKLESNLSDQRIFCEQWGTPKSVITILENELNLTRKRLLELLTDCN